jgi:hypothetical protein
VSCSVVGHVLLLFTMFHCRCVKLADLGSARSVLLENHLTGLNSNHKSGLPQQPPNQQQQQQQHQQHGQPAAGAGEGSSFQQSQHPAAAGTLVTHARSDSLDSLGAGMVGGDVSKAGRLSWNHLAPAADDSPVVDNSNKQQQQQQQLDEQDEAAAATETAAFPGKGMLPPSTAGAAHPGRASSSGAGSGGGVGSGRYLQPVALPVHHSDSFLIEATSSPSEIYAR